MHPVETRSNTSILRIFKTFEICRTKYIFKPETCTLISRCILPIVWRYASPWRVSLHIYAICNSFKGPVTENKKVKIIFFTKNGSFNTYKRLCNIIYIYCGICLEVIPHRRTPCKSIIYPVWDNCRSMQWHLDDGNLSSSIFLAESCQNHLLKWNNR